MKNMNSNNNEFTVSEETAQWIRAIVKLDDIFNGLSSEAADSMKSNYKGFREQLTGRMAQCIAQNICLDARRI